MKKLYSSVCVLLIIACQCIVFCKKSGDSQKKEISDVDQKVYLEKIFGTWQNRNHPSYILEITKKGKGNFTISYLGGEYYLENATANCEQDSCVFSSAKYPDDSWTIRPVQGQKSAELIIVKAPFKDPKMSYPARDERPLIEPNSIFEPCPKYICE